MILDLVLVAFGLAGLYFGGEWLVKAASRLAESYGVPPIIIGLTIVAVGTSMPELVVSVSAAIAGSSDISLGNIVGSNIANIGLILGISGLIITLTIHESLIRQEIPVMIVVSVVLFAFATTGTITGVMGLVLLAGYAGFIYLLYRGYQTQANGAGVGEIEAEVEAIEGEPQAVNRRTEFIRMAGGIVLLVIGAQLTVTGAVNLARSFGVSELVIGLTLVAVGTSLPELATSVVAALRNHSDIAVGNVVGSNIANILIILGLTSIVRPIQVNPSLLRLEFPAMIAFAVILFPFVLDRKLERWAAGLFLLAYLAFVVFLFASGSAEAVVTAP